MVVGAKDDQNIASRRMWAAWLVPTAVTVDKEPVRRGQMEPATEAEEDADEDGEEEVAVSMFWPFVCQAM